MNAPIAHARKRRGVRSVLSQLSPVYRPADGETPFRAELFSADQMEEHGRALATSHRIDETRAPDRLLGRLADNDRVLVDTCDQLTAAVRDNRRITPAAEWLLDNFYLIEEQIRLAKRHLPKRYSRELPRLADGPSAGLPRAYDLALETIAHADGRLDIESLSRFIAAYQVITPLSLGELWGIPIMLRLALIENLRRVARRIADGARDRAVAGVWADRMMEAADRDPTNLILVVADMARSNPQMVSPFVAELARRLQGQAPALALSLSWIEQRLGESGRSIEHMVQIETQKQAADQVSISNSIGSLRGLSAIDWREFVESMSLVEQKLREDPADVYGRMDFATRDRYRHGIERIARHTRLSELDVARKVVQLAHDGARSADGDERERHVGFYLVDRGRAQLEAAAAVALPPFEHVRRLAQRAPLVLYLGAIALLALVVAAALTELAHVDGGRSGGSLVAAALLSVIAASHLSLALVNWLSMLLARPEPLPRMDFGAGIPSEFRTLVVVPTMLGSDADIDTLLEALEVRFLSNRDRNLHFALLTDFPDAQQETLPGDAALVERAVRGIEQLNLRYRNSRGNREAVNDDVFFLLHRPRRWNPQERLWMGWERKRGKLEELNALLRGVGSGNFAQIAGDIEVLGNIRYVITLDTDTQLPRESAHQLVGAMAHALNRPRFDDTLQRVVDGYGILQPRVSIAPARANRSLYARLSSSEPGIDPYTRVVSDVYQDLFAEGSFIGKGIYDVDAFRRALNDRMPENRILSHDLIEGCHARSGLISDVQLYEDTPAHYLADIGRRHRWIRGDCQVAQWALPRLFADSRGSRRNPLSPLSRWKVFDNLRRITVAPSLTALLLLGWFGPGSAVFRLLWTLSIVAIVLVPPLCGWLHELFHKADEVRMSQHLRSTLRAARIPLAHAGLTLVMLPYEAYVSLDAALKTAWRMLISRRNLLEWSTARDAERRVSSQATLAGTYRAMWVAPALAAAWLVALAIVAPPATVIAVAPFLALWLASPAIAWWVSRPLVRPSPQLSAQQMALLQATARKSWMFFETFVGPADNWLPPDNYQEQPVDVIAHRTSPTNIGLSLLANLAAHDFGYITRHQLVERTRNTLAAMEKLERYHGHFLNWYDTRSLQPLSPRYVSSVDSGNLAGHLLVLRGGLSALAGQPLVDLRVFEGLGDTLRVLTTARDGPGTAALSRLRRDLDSAYDAHPSSAEAMVKWLQRLRASAAGLRPPSAAAEETGDWVRWLDAFIAQCDAALSALAPLLSSAVTGAAEGAQAPSAADALHAEIESLIAVIDRMSDMEYGFLYDAGRNLLSIGYNVSDRRRDPSYYDLLASEARLASFVAIAQGKLPQDNWFAFSRLLTQADGEPVLLSWSGSMFEYLMPLLVMPTYDHTLLDKSCRAAVARQIAYGAERGVPWGISESGYNAVDASLNYQYRAFGVPGIGLKRGLVEDLVIAPYATVLALMIAPEAAASNLQRLAAIGLDGQYGFYEAIDYTASRMPRGQTSVIIRSFMAHHQGMSLLSLAWLLRGGPMQRRFNADPQLQSALLLLQERVPKVAAYFEQPETLADIRATSTEPALPMRVLTSADTAAPEAHLLSNGRYHVMISNAGGGYSRWKDLAVTRWREDATCDNWGTFCYIRDVATGAYWSAAHQPTKKRALRYEAIFSEGRAEFRRRDAVEGAEFRTHVEIVVSPEDDIELRRLHITNRSRARRSIEVTSYAEVVLAPQAADAAHPAFSNLFVQTEIVHPRHAILCTRRPRAPEEAPPWLLHQMVVHGASVEAVTYETDRSRFIGRGNTPADPEAMRGTVALSGSDGSVLDPIVAIRYRVTIEADQSAVFDVVTGVSETREGALALIAKHQDRHLADRVFDLAWTHSAVSLSQINASEGDAQLFGRLAGAIVYAGGGLRAPAAIIARNRRGQSGLWSYSISGDVPIVLLQISNAENIDLVRQMIQAHAYWRLKGLSVDLVIWNEDREGYRQLLQEQIMGLVAAGVEAQLMDRPGGIFVRRAEQIPDEDRVLLQSVARVIISDRRGTLAEQINRRSTDARAAAGAGDAKGQNAPAFKAAKAVSAARAGNAAGASASAADLASAAAASSNLAFFNGLGGFAAGGREYVIVQKPGEATPAPWVNVLANPAIGTIVSESGMGYTWSENAHQFRLTPWSNDPVSDTGGEAFYLRDEETGSFWSPTALPARGSGVYVSRHGFGYSIFEHAEDGIVSELTVYVDIEAPVKYAVLKVRNDSGRPRRLSATGYVEWVLGEARTGTMMHVISEIDPGSGALAARNAYNAEFPDRVAFFDVDEITRTQALTFTGDRTEFIGRNGSLKNPAAMRREQLSNRTGAAMDPCAAIQVAFDLPPGQSREMIFRLGAGSDADVARKLMHRARGPASARTALERVKGYWVRTLGAVQVDTGDPSIDILANGWLVYQVLACRYWGRSGFYQSGGAYGFRDQLQDAMALLHAEPLLLRAHLVRSASHQFRDGDVQHWWHPPGDRGVRTRCSDDYLWLPLATARYVEATGDIGVLQEPAPWLEGRAVPADAESYYDLPSRSERRGSLYEHCVAAVVHGLRYGEHGLPLIGSGDWNDGMNLVGIHGKGESVWLAFFLHEVLARFIGVARLQGDLEMVERCRFEASRLQRNIEQHAWDGNWYLRAWFDDGTPLGSAVNPECRIDAIAQSWAVLSGAADRERARTAMSEVDQRLVRRSADSGSGLIQLLDPPFDKSALNPGYIRGYVPGVRENGGQYTHAAVWTTMAFAALGDAERAWELMRLINPLHHGDTALRIARYKVEPYVVAADVYARPPHAGRGGWTWYTGSAGWMYRLIVESLLGLRLEVDRLRFTPVLPAAMKSYAVAYRYRETTYQITVRQLDADDALEAGAVGPLAGIITIVLDGALQEGDALPLVDDRQPHVAEVKFRGRTQSAPRVAPRRDGS